MWKLKSMRCFYHERKNSIFASCINFKVKNGTI
nr:MAG TPA: hypothetical protein [Caudoviricetes sp.]DAV19974.1 MAG TPA: hypothetical protein [Caudoviricetes sp.]